MVEKLVLSRSLPDVMYQLNKNFIFNTVHFVDQIFNKYIVNCKIVSLKAVIICTAKKNIFR